MAGPARVRLVRRSLSFRLSVAGRFRKMSGDLHAVVKYAQDVDPIAVGTVQQEVARLLSLPCDMKAAQTGQDVVPRLAAERIGAGLERANGGLYEGAVASRLSNAEAFRRPDKDGCEVPLRRRAEPGAPG